MKTIRIAAALLLRQDGMTLLVRKRGTTAFMQPGGKIDSGETPEGCIIRELREELELHINSESLEPLGKFTADAANEPDHRVVADVFVVSTTQCEFFPAAEIEEVRWVWPSGSSGLPMAPLTANHIFPAFLKMRKPPANDGPDIHAG